MVRLRRSRFEAGRIRPPGRRPPPVYPLAILVILAIVVITVSQSRAPVPPTPGKETPGASAAPGATLAPAPTPSASPGTVTVASIPDLKRALADDSITEIVVRDGTYRVSPSNDNRPDSLWIGGDAYASRTQPVTVRAETRGGVVFEGSGGEGYGGLSFEDGAHHQTWDGFTFANMAAHYTGIVEVGGYTPRRAPHHITIRNFTILSSVTGRATTAEGNTWDHAFYIAHALEPGPHDLLFEDITVDGRGGLASAFQFYHSASGAPNASNVTVRRLTVTGTQQAIILWDSTLRDVIFDTVTITDPLAYAVRYETIGADGITLENITSIGSGKAGFFSSMGGAPAGLNLIAASLR